MPADDVPLIAMVGTAREGAGGIASVISTYAAHGLFERWPIAALDSHVVDTKWRKLAAFVNAWLRYFMLLLRGRVGLLHLHASSGPSFWRKMCFAFPAFWLKVPVILHLHSGQFAAFYAQDCGPLRRRLVRTMLGRAARVIALSPIWQARARDIAPNAEVVCIPNPLMDGGGQPRRLTGRVAVFLGKVSADKGVFDLIQAWRIVRGGLSDARLVIAGEGELDAVRQQIKAMGLADSVTLPGWVSGAAKAALLDQASVCVLPSYFEGLPMSLLETMAAGLPCVATAVGGIPDMIADGVEGRLVAAGDVDALAAALLALWSDEARYAAMSRAALARFESAYSANRVMPLLEKLYQDLGMKTRGSTVFSLQRHE